MSAASDSPIGPAVSGRVQTAQAAEGAVDDGRCVREGGECGEEEEGRLGHWTAEMGMGTAWVGAAQNKSEGPNRHRKEVHVIVEKI